jgi:colicin import membrane protein
MAAIAMKHPHAHRRDVGLGLAYSLLIHGAILAALLISLPLAPPENLPPPPAIDVQLAKIGPKTNIPPELHAKAPSPPPPARQTHIAKPVAPTPPPKIKAPPAPPAPPPAPKVAAAKPVPVPPPPKPEVKPKPKPQPVAKPKPKPPTKVAATPPVPVPLRVPVAPPKAKPKNAFNANALAQMLNLELKHQSTAPNAANTKSRLNAYSQTPANTNQPLSLSLIDALREQIENNWSVLPSACGKNAQIEIQFALNPDGSLQGQPRIVNTITDPVIQAAAQSALRAIYKSQPFKMLPANMYQQWQSITVTFSPKDVCQ